MQEKINNIINKNYRLLLFLICSCFFLLSTSYKILNPEFIDYLSPGDMETHWLGWLYFKDTPFFQFPLLANYSYGLENWSGTLIHTDSLPLMALIFRPFSAYLPNLFQYFGIWIYLCFLLQGFSSFYLMNLLLKDKVKSLLASCFFIIAPIFLWRLWGHYSLLAQGVILIAFYLYFLNDTKTRPWGYLLLFSALINAYLTGMIMLIFACYLLKINLSFKEFVIKFFKMILFLIGFMWVLGVFQTGTSFMAGGYGLYRMNINALINSTGDHWSTLLPELPSADYDHDGFAFLGVGVIILFILSVSLFIKNRKHLTIKKEYVILLCLGLFCFIFALSDNITLGSKIIFSYETPYIFKVFTKTFRSSARFIWIPHYLIIICGLYLLNKYTSKKGFVIIALSLLLLQIYDSRKAFVHFAMKHSSPTEYWSGAVVNEKGLVRTKPLLENQPFKNKIWNKVTSKYNKFTYVIPKNRPGDYFEIAFLAARNKIQINFGYFARYSKKNEKIEKERLVYEINKGIFDKNAAYFFWNEELFNIAKLTKGEYDLIDEIDGYKILLPGFYDKK